MSKKENDTEIEAPGKYKSTTIWYRQNADSLTIDIYIKNISEIYTVENIPDFEDTNPELDSGFIEYIISYLKEEKKVPLESVRVKFHLAPNLLNDTRYRNIEADFLETVSTLCPLMERKVKKTKKKGRQKFTIGFLTIVLFLGAAEILYILCETRGLVVGISQGLSVISWVLLWEPIDYFIFERAGVLRSAKWLQKLLGSSVEKVAWDGCFAQDKHGINKVPKRSE